MQVRDPFAPHMPVSFGSQTPWPMHGPQSPQLPFSHTRDRVPHRPQASVGAGPAQLWPVQVPHWQAWLHVCIPLSLTPHMRVAPAAHGGSPMQALHALQVPLLHVRVRVPPLQLPHACVESPTQAHAPHWH